MKAKTAISLLISSIFMMGAAHAEQTTNDDISNMPFGGVSGQPESGLTREQVLAELRDAPRPGPFDELPLGQGDSGTF